MSDTFGKWAKDRGLVKVGAGALALLSPTLLERAVSISAGVAGWLPKVVLENLPAISNLTVLILIVAITIAVQPVVDYGKYPKASRAVETFRYLWIAFWCWFLLLYLYQTVVGVFFAEVTPERSFDAWAWRNFWGNALSFVALLILFLCYVVLAGYRMLGYIVGGALVVILIAVLEAVGVHSMAALNPKLRMLLVQLWQVVLATFACTIFALLIGRLESKIIRPPLLIIFALYFYGALQPVAAVLGSTKYLAMLDTYYLDMLETSELRQAFVQLQGFLMKVGAWLIFVAALLKILFFALILWLMDGVLLFYASWLSGEGAAGGPGQALLAGLDRQRADFVYAARSAAAERAASGG